MKAFAYGIALAGLVLAARSATADSSLDRVRACMPQQNDAARLACYDKELGRTAAAPAAATTGARPATAARPTAAAAVATTAARPTAATTAATAAGNPAKAATAAVPGTATASTKSADFGMTPELLRKQQEQAGIKVPPAPPESLSAKVAKVGTYGAGLLVVTLDNGQVWAQQESGNAQLAVGDAVKISRGMFGALWMDDASHRRTRVKRVQ
jgi:hypothetical protein